MQRRLCCFKSAICAILAVLWPLCAQAETKKDRFYFERLGYAFWQVKTEKKVVALTFDDGPDPTYTPKILRLLERYHDHATFFLIGSKVQQYPEVTHQVFSLGNELGNHTFSHCHIADMSERELSQELRKTNDAIVRATGLSPKYFRPPRGFYDENSVLTAHQNGYPVIMWSWDEDSHDWQAPGVGKIVQTVLKHVHSGDIILFHDGTNNSKQTVAALTTILPTLQREGYKCVTISELLSLSNHKEDDEPDD
ncbi:polysaccharide deacetylase family protein [Alicyclobacillus fodiniaquatilis]|uniref:Polysaccharide deacetylase family protein n=1 Tax=Alicyclobacillus fodiniaquatilis TaxID=1661150 RepID=A0ABW4JL88_9BACL